MWKPIDTAPKNRKVLVHYLNPLGNYRIVMACFYGEKCLTMDLDDSEGGIYDEDSGETFAPAGWYEEHEHDDPLRTLDCEPTHWMPLPPPPGAESPASASPNIPESNDRADAALASADSEDAARFRWLCNDHDDRAARHLRDSLIERISVMSLSAVRAAIDIHLKNRLEPPHKPGTCQQCGRYLDRRGRCRFPEHNA